MLYVIAIVLFLILGVQMGLLYLIRSDQEVSSRQRSEYILLMKALIAQKEVRQDIAQMLAHSGTGRDLLRQRILARLKPEPESHVAAS